MSDFATREKNRTYYQEHREQILRATKEWRKRNREKYRAYQKEYWSKHYRNYGTKNRVADRAMRERKKPDVEKALIHSAGGGRRKNPATYSFCYSFILQAQAQLPESLPAFSIATQKKGKKGVGER
jgi:hypothetical protein